MFYWGNFNSFFQYDVSSGNLKLLNHTFFKPNSPGKPDDTAILFSEKIIFSKQSGRIFADKVLIGKLTRGYEYNVKLTYDDSDGYENVVYLPTIKVSYVAS